MSFDKKQAIFTTVLTNETLNINFDDGITAVSIILKSGAGTFYGTKPIGSRPSSPIPLDKDLPANVSAEQTKYLDEFTIDCSGGGVIQVIAR